MSPANKPGAIVRAAQNALERRVQSSHEEMVLQQSNFLTKAITWALIATTGSALAWLAFAKTDEVLIATGKLQPIGDVKVVQMPVGGVLQTMLVKDGEKVKKGQVLLRLDNEASLDRQARTRQSITAKEQQLALKKVELDRYLNLNETEQAVLNQNLGLEKEILDNGWLTVPADLDVMFEVPVDQRFDAAMKLLGFDPLMLATVAGHA